MDIYPPKLVVLSNVREHLLPCNSLHLAQIKVNRELLADTSSGANSTKHIEVSLPKGLKYNTADNAGVIPHNPSSMVDSLVTYLSVDPSATFTLKGPSSDYKALFPTPCTVRDALTKYVDLLTPPRRSDLKLLAKYAPPGLSRDFLGRLASKEGKSEYEDKIKVRAHEVDRWLCAAKLRIPPTCFSLLFVCSPPTLASPPS